MKYVRCEVCPECGGLVPIKYSSAFKGSVQTIKINKCTGCKKYWGIKELSVKINQQSK